MKKQLSLILAFYMILSVLTGCGSVRTQEYTLECGVSLTAASGMKETAQEPFTTTLQGTKVIVAFLEEHKSVLGSEELTLQGYAGLVKNGNSLDADFAENAQGVLTNQRVKDGYFFYICVYETGSSFWLIQFACAEENQEKYAPLFQEWSGTVVLQDTQAPDVEAVTETVYTLDVGAQITLPEGLTQVDMEGYDVFMHNNRVAFALNHEEKPADWTLEDYAAALSEGYGIATLAQNSHGVLASAYSTENEGVVNYYYITVYETEEAFWVCQIFCLESAVETYGNDIARWASSLTFDQ